ncbi:carbohydrate kinase family protein [Aeromicrobium sp. PE09-221]|uniref:carbohydrate kinase family protein n=1 Tax=Aeromicrobium sp. PE09-221 TaxID=1898043 RepID=UPI000B3E94C3|nr:carbohydrate kinase family protein [Aeromicrobium sp. PE09-221]OUZ09500.1 carbohydrate kinase family protein [Aeromicrobium sp. PE09-221]
MHLAIAGSVATDHLQTFSGRFSDSLVPDQLDKISVSFLVEDLDVRRGGCAANISFGLAQLGHRPLLVAAVGQDFVAQGYEKWLDSAGVDCSRLRISDTRHTALCTITTDDAHAQIVTFYPGAMAEAREIDIASLHAERPIDLLLVGPDDPTGMLRHTHTARELSIPFAADPSQQLAWADGELIADLIDGAAYLFCNEYEAALIEKKTGWSDDDLRRHVGTRVVTHGKDGAVVHTAEGELIEVSAIEGITAVDPTGVGDSFRAGYLAGVAAGLSAERSVQVGCTIAACVVETIGTQEYTVDADTFLRRLGQQYGDEARAEIHKALSLGGVA